MTAGHIKAISESSIAAPMPKAKETATGMASRLLSRGCDCRLRGMAYELRLVDGLSLRHTFESQSNSVACSVDVNDTYPDILPHTHHIGGRGDKLLREL